MLNAKELGFDNKLVIQGFTIDSESTQDVDDGIWIETIQGGWNLYVSIADVAQFVPIDSEIDKRALDRGETIYLPNKSIPMLGEDLTQEYSLLPGKPKSAITVKVAIARTGKVISKDVFLSSFLNQKKYSYEEVDKLLQDKPPKSLYELNKLAHVLSSRKRGILPSLDGYTFNEDGNLVKATRSQQMIAEAMILANTMVAQWMEERFLPILYRVHPVPEGLAKEMNELKRLNTLDFAYALVDKMPRAYYSIYNQGHFALGLDSYCHFTSPIRRYADLVNHRIIRAYLRRTPQPYSRLQLNNIAIHLNSLRDQRKEEYKEHDEDKLKKTMQNNYLATSLDEKRFSKLLRIASENDKLDSHLIEFALQKVDKLPSRDLALLFFKSQRSRQAILDFFRGESSAKILEVFHVASQAFGFTCKWEDLTIDASHFCWLCLDGETSINPGEGLSKSEAKNNAAILWMEAFANSELINQEEVDFLGQDIKKVEGIAINLEADNPIGELQVFCQKSGIELPTYSYMAYGKGEDAIQCTCTIALDLPPTTGKGRNKRTGKKEAAIAMLRQIAFSS